MHKKLFYFVFPFFCSNSLYGQFMVDTLDAIEVRSSRTAKKPNFSTFTKKISINNSTFGLTFIEPDTSIKAFIFPNAIQVQNIKGIKVQLDSILIKSSIIDTSKITLTLNVYASNKLFSSSKVWFVYRKGDVNSAVFDIPLFLPPGTSYLGFSFVSKAGYNTLKSQYDRFSLYTNKKILGYLYSYNKEKDEFKLLEYEDMPPITCPQIKLYYTKMD